MNHRVYLYRRAGVFYKVPKSPRLNTGLWNLGVKFRLYSKGYRTRSVVVWHHDKCPDNYMIKILLEQGFYQAILSWFHWCRGFRCRPLDYRCSKVHASGYYRISPDTPVLTGFLHLRLGPWTGVISICRPSSSQHLQPSQADICAQAILLFRITYKNRKSSTLHNLRNADLWKSSPWLTLRLFFGLRTIMRTSGLEVVLYWY